MPQLVGIVHHVERGDPSLGVGLDGETGKTARAEHEAILAGAFDVARRMSTAAVAARMTGTALTPPERQVIGSFLESLRSPARVVVRQGSAQFVMGGEGISLSVGLALEDGQWRLSD